MTARPRLRQTSSSAERGRGVLAAVLVAFVVTLAGCGTSEAPTSGAPTPVATSSVPSPTSSAPTSPAPSGPAPLPKERQVSVTSVRIGSIGLKTASLEKLALLSNGELAAPKNPDRAGWFAGGTVPGQVGPAVIAGHIDSKTGPAVFFELRLVSKGDQIKVGLSDGRTVTFRVDRVITTAKKGFPTDEVFGPTPDAELRLITCGGPYDRTVQSYLDNTIVFATRLN
ncbi:hypothetical protein FHX74_000090 [Friedmanniella endophytica]|uniref:Sortase family protein n=1 Tax=Microlunatus kandeliicorticis TaxID=1759536 RepID=A0A7W3P443_9ACTN|nr:class F sortase [Microlunatus kandeliicorticis]MBA8792496.1 hypothetical protein [Microlunatus kandeliicorticis]